MAEDVKKQMNEVNALASVAQVQDLAAKAQSPSVAAPAARHAQRKPEAAPQKHGKAKSAHTHASVRLAPCKAPVRRPPLPHPSPRPRPPLWVLAPSQAFDKELSEESAGLEQLEALASRNSGGGSAALGMASQLAGLMPGLSAGPAGGRARAAQHGG